MKLEKIIEILLIIVILFLVATMPTIIINRQYLLDNKSICGGSQWLTSETYEKECKCYSSEIKEANYIKENIEYPVDKATIPLLIVSFIIFMTTLFKGIKYKNTNKIRILSMIVFILELIMFFVPTVIN